MIRHLRKIQATSGAVVFYLWLFAILGVNGANIDFTADAYYYFTVARNVADGSGSTFDGVSLTTGYHPLWLGLLTIVAFFFESVSNFHYAVYSLSAFLFVSGHMLLARVAKLAGLPQGVFFLVSVAVFAVNLTVFQAGMENSLAFFFLAVFLWVQYRTWKNQGGQAVATAVVLVAVYFARLDFAFLLAVSLPWYAIVKWRSGRVWAAIGVPAVVIAAVAGHLGFMWLNFGTIYSTSQIAINNHLALGGSENLLQALAPASHILTTRLEGVLAVLGVTVNANTTSNPERLLGLTVPLSMVAGLAVLAWRDLRTRTPITLVGVTALLQLMYYAIFLDGWMRSWYFTGWYVLAVFAMGFFLAKPLGKLDMRVVTGLVGLGMMGVLFVSIGRDSPSVSYFQENSNLLSRYDINGTVFVGHTPDRAVYFSGVPVRHLEGLMNGYDFLDDYLKPEQFASYIKSTEATHYVLSNAPVLPDFIPCRLVIARADRGQLTAIGEYERHNRYVAVYRVAFAGEGAVRERGDTCGPAEATGGG